MKRWQLMLIAWFLFIGYLLAGAFLFRAIEQPDETRAEEAFARTREEFLRAHPCVSGDELLLYSRLVVEAASRGAVDFSEDGSGGSHQAGDPGAAVPKNVWDLPNSFFFSATVVTTIGYGDIAPQTPLGRIVCVIYAVVGLPLTAWVIGVIARSLTAYWTRALDKADKLLLVCLRFARLRKAAMILVTVVVLYAVLFQAPAVALGHIEQWDILTAVYYLFITLTTIGFGDLVVGNHPDFAQSARWSLKIGMVLYVILGLSLLVALSSAIAERANKAVKKTRVPSNSYRVKCAHTLKGRERASVMLEGEIALSHVPNLSSARLTEGQTEEDEVAFVIRSLSNHEDDVPPGYEDVVIDMSKSEVTVRSESTTERSDGLNLAAKELSVHQPAKSNGHFAGRNGHISVISKDEHGCLDLTGPSILNHP